MRLEPILLLLSAQLGHAYLYVQGMNGSISVCGLFTSIGSYSNSKDSSASFGPIVPATGVRGLLIRPTNDVHGCSIVSRLPGFIALVLRGKCSFTEKIRKMQSSGAIAVIVGNNIPSKPLMHMVPSDGSADIYIPSVFITREDYDFLIRHLAVYPAGVQVYLTRNPFDTPFWHVLLIGLLGPGGLILTLYFLNLLRQKWLSIYKAHRCQYALIRTRVQPFVPSSQGAESDFCLCTICLETYQEGDLLRVLNCGHGYHKACCDRWFEYSLVCPLCKRMIV